ncbi:MAG TPA: MBL fold metallo-hydrolase [Phycisphaerae bacterium]|nr:MBL fold metallo-hydrolase [Phycisphaerae bacterium]HRY69350.1 MBL fold metallo-hydrolase [Phycisphaerae bacterium]HSA26217.1 MBL fold metallo-hydrolase [Phycisphaerae bacterium]
MASLMVEKQVGSVRLQGFSLAGEENVIAAPELNVAFDVGRAPREVVAMDHVCLSHGHMDHAAGLAYYFSQRNFQDMPAGTVLVQNKLVGPIQDLMRVWARIEGHLSPHNVVGVDEDEDYEVRRGLVVRPFRVRHPGPTLGFSLIEVRKKLKPEYAELSGPQIVDLKRTGKEIEYRLEVPKVAFCGDTEAGPFLDHDHVRNAEVIILECTFFEPDHLDRARKGQHTHVQDLPAIMERLRNPHVVISHITRRTFMHEVKQTLQRMLKPVDLERITILMDRPRRTPPRVEKPASAPAGQDADRGESQATRDC